jgi:hypothetical protein
MKRDELVRRAIVKAVTYRLLIVSLDVVKVYALTSTVKRSQTGLAANESSSFRLWWSNAT